MSNEPELTTKELFRKWLEKLQQESWQLELLISGFALYGIYESKSFISEISLYSDKVSNPFFINVLTTLLNVGWKIFFINLLVHVILRSLWIGAIGLRYVSGEIDYERLNYSEKFTTYLEKKVGDYDDFIEKLERICSVLFSYTFLLFLFFLSAFLFFIIGIIPIILLETMEFEKLQKIAPYLNILWVIPYFLFSLVVFVDFISLGGIKRVKDNIIPKLYMPLYRFYSTITLSFLYRPLIYNFIDDKYTRKLFFLSLPYILLVTFGHRIVSSVENPHIAQNLVLKDTGLSVYHHYYEDLAQDHKESGSKLFQNRSRLPDFRLSSYYQEEDMNSIFIKTRRKDKDILEKVLKVEPHYVSGIRFSLFRSHKVNEQGEQKDIEASYSKLFSPLLQERKNLKRTLRRSKDDKQALQAKIDSIDHQVKQLRLEKDHKLEAYNQTKHQKILSSYMELFHFSINEQSYQDSLNCYFSTHPNNNESGLLCHYSTAHLPEGHHTISLKRISNFEPLKNNRVDTTFYKIPFIKK